MKVDRRRLLLVATLVAAVVALIVFVPPAIRSVMEPPGGERIIVVLKTVGPHMEFWQIVRAGILVVARRRSDSGHSVRRHPHLRYGGQTGGGH